MKYDNWKTTKTVSTLMFPMAFVCQAGWTSISISQKRMKLKSAWNKKGSSLWGKEVEKASMLPGNWKILFQIFHLQEFFMKQKRKPQWMWFKTQSKMTKSCSLVFVRVTSFKLLKVKLKFNLTWNSLSGTILRWKSFEVR